MTVVDPHIRVEGVPDWRSVDALLASLVGPQVSGEAMGDEARVLAVFHAVRRMFVHGPTPAALAYDFHKVMHVLGTGACLSMTTPLHLLYERLGYRSQSWVHDGHHMMQVEYGGAWHCLDPHMSFSCYDRSQPPQLAGLEQLRADASLARDAVAEGRAGAGYLLCGDAPEWFAGDAGEWHLEAGGDWPAMRVDEPFGGIALRPGETYVRTWHPGATFYRAGWLARDGCGPIHHCAEADRQDTANWPLYEPHAWVRPDNGRTYHRAWGVGRLEYEPCFTDDSWRAGIDASQPGSDGVTVVDDALTAADPARAGEVTFEVGCPYVLTAARVQLRLARGGRVRAWVQVRDADTVAPAEKGRDLPRLAHDWTEVNLAVDPAAAGASGWVGDLDDEVNGCFEGYQLRLQLADGARLAGLRLVSHFQLNRYSLPHLRPGRNVVHVSAGRYGSPLTVRYAWSEGPGWTQAREHEVTVGDDVTFAVDIAGPAWPRMGALILAVPPPS